jgi:hypothetical protein
MINILEKTNMTQSGDTYNINQAGAVGKFARSDNNTFNYSQNNQTLAEAAKEIQRLLVQLEIDNPNATYDEQINYISDETSPSFQRRLVGAWQAASETAIDEFILENKYLKVAKAWIKGLIKPD